MTPFCSISSSFLQLVPLLEFRQPEKRTRRGSMCERGWAVASMTDEGKIILVPATPG